MDVSPASGNAWVDCACGARHWGRFGAAGLMLLYVVPPPPPSADDDGADRGHDVEVLLQHRAAWTHEGGTWALPGGARAEGESARDAALREAAEEAGLDPAGVRVLDTDVIDHGPWSYSYVIARADVRPHVTPSDEETQGLAWVSLADVPSYPLHPLFASAWPALALIALSLLSDS